MEPWKEIIVDLTVKSAEPEIVVHEQLLNDMLDIQKALGQKESFDLAFRQSVPFKTGNTIIYFNEKLEDIEGTKFPWGTYATIRFTYNNVVYMYSLTSYWEELNYVLVRDDKVVSCSIMGSLA